MYQVVPSTDYGKGENVSYAIGNMLLLYVITRQIVHNKIPYNY